MTEPLPYRSTETLKNRNTVYFGLMVLLGYWGVLIYRLSGMWSALPEYSYGWAVPMLCAMLFMERWRTRPAEKQKFGKQKVEISSAASGERGAASRERGVGGVEDGGRRTAIRGQRTEDGGKAESRKQKVEIGSGEWGGERGAGIRERGSSRFALGTMILAACAFVLARLGLEVIPTWRFAAWTLALATIALTMVLLRMVLGEGGGGRRTEDGGRRTEGGDPMTEDRARRTEGGGQLLHFAFPILFFLLAVPWPSSFEIPFIQALTSLNAATTVELLSFLKVPAVQMGNIILIEPGMVGVQEACSGIRSFQSTMMVALFLGELFRFSVWRRVAFIVLGALLSFGFNIVRTSFLVWTCNREGLGAVDKFHDPAGWTILAASIAGLGLIGWGLFRSQKQKLRKQKAEISSQGGEWEAGRWERGVGSEELRAGSREREAATDYWTTGQQTTDHGGSCELRGASAEPGAEDGIKVESRKQKAEISLKAESRKQKAEIYSNAETREPRTEDEGSGELRAGSREREAKSSGQSSRGLISVFGLLLAILVVTEVGIRWWFAMHEMPHQQRIDWTTRFDAEGSTLKPLKISKEVRAMLDYDRGSGWQWQGGGAERWQAFYFIWDKPKTLARQIVSSGAATGHQPEVCFTAAGMQVRQIYGKRRYVVNGVPLVFKVYEFADRNIPIFVFACTWERNAEQTTAEEDLLKGDASTSRGFRQAVHQLARGDRGITDEVRVFKLGVWGPRTLGEAEASFQQQLKQLVGREGGQGGSR